MLFIPYGKSVLQIMPGQSWGHLGVIAITEVHFVIPLVEKGR